MNQSLASLGITFVLLASVSMWAVVISQASWQAVPSLTIHALGVGRALNITDSCQSLVTVGIIWAAGGLHTEVVVALVASITIGVAVTAWLASVVGQITPEAGGVWVACCITDFIIVVAHIVAGAVARDGVAIATHSLTLKPRWTLGIGRTLVIVAHIVVANLETVLDTGGQK